MKYINVAEANCKNCYKCLKVCPVKSIKYSENHVEVLEDDCILCGRCIRNCPQKAKSLINDITPVKELLADKTRKKVATLAPSYISSFGSENRLKLAAALLKLGFDSVEETAVGAHAVSMEYARILEEGIMDNMITTCCPSTVFLVQKYFPNLTKQLAPVLSPMETHGQIISKEWGQDVSVVFFGPCISKIEEARISVPHYIDHVVTFKQLSSWFSEREIILSDLEDGYFGNVPTASSIYPVYEGIIYDVKSNLRPGSTAEEKYTFISVQGTKDLIELLQEMDNGKIHNCFIEASTCYGSCINGPEKPDSDYQPISLSLEMRRYIKNMEAEKQPQIEGILFHREIEPDARHQDIPNEKTIRNILAQIGKNTPDQELNCGSCGYRTCRDKAIAVYQKKAELNMCMPYMIQISETLSNVTLSVSPNYIIAIDNKLRILECNLAAQRLFNLTRNDIVGSRIDEFLNPVDFAVAVGNRESQMLSKVRYDKQGIIVNQTIVYVPEQDIAVAFLQDITREEKEEELLNKLKLDTMNMAQAVIDKQMTVAQEIASLLGETTAETKVTLTKLKDLIIYEGKENDGKTMH